MPFTNQSTTLHVLFRGLDDRLRKVENAKRFTAPVVATDPTRPLKGDIWLNSTTNQLKVVDANGTVRVITWV